MASPPPPVFSRAALRPSRVPTEASDAHLIAAFGRGCRESGDTLARRYYARVAMVCRRYLRNAEDAADAAQEIFFKVLGERKVLGFQGRAQFWTWLYRITVNTCKTWLLRRRRCLTRACTPGSLDNGAAPGGAAGAATPEENCLADQHRVLLERLLTDLPEKYRLPIRFVCLEEKTYDEAARCLGISPQTLGVQLLRGKLLLSKLGGRAWGEPG